MKAQFRLVHESARERAVDAIKHCPLDGTVIKLSGATRTLDQNAALWPLLECFSQQLRWPVNGMLVNLDPEDWKHILTAAFREENVRIANGLNGGMVMLGQRTSRFSKREFSDFLDFIYATALERNVQLDREEA